MIEASIAVLTYLEPVLCAVVLALLLWRRSAKDFIFLAGFLAVRLMSTICCLVLVQLSSTHIEKHLAYKLLFYVYWTSYVLEAVLCLCIIYGVYRAAMVPLEGLQRLGVLVFRWAAAISVALAFAYACNSRSLASGLISVIVQLQQTSSLLTLCLMLFVCFAVRPLGLSYKDRIFGVSFGLGIIATASLVNSAWFSQRSMVQSYVSLINGFATFFAFVIWGTYFALPEPKRRILAIPTTSPFLHWNQISKALGDEPGMVAIGGVSPDVFAPAEIEMMFRASAKMNELETVQSENTDGNSGVHSLIA